MDSDLNRNWPAGGRYPLMEKPGPSLHYGGFDERETAARSHRYELSHLESGLWRLNLAEAEGSIDPRLVAILEYLRELYMTREEIVKNTFPGLHDGFVGQYQQIGDLLAQIKSIHREAPGTMRRCLSFGSPGSDLKLRKSKIKTLPDFDYFPPPQAPAGGNIVEPGGSKITPK